MENQNLKEITLKIFKILKSRPTDSRKAGKPLYPENLDNLNESYGVKPEGEEPLIPSSDKPGPQHIQVTSEQLNPVKDEESADFYTLMTRYQVKFEIPDKGQLLEVLAIIANTKIPLKHIQQNECLEVIRVQKDDNFLAKYNNSLNILDLSAKLFSKEWRMSHPFHRIANVPAIYELLIHEIGHSVEKFLHETNKPIIDPLFHKVTGWAYPDEETNAEALQQKGYIPAIQTFLAVPVEKMTTLEDLEKDREFIADRIKEKNPHQLPDKVMKISWYGCVGPREDFAESYANYVLNGKKMKQMEPDRYEYMRTYIFDSQEYSDLEFPKSAMWQEIMSRIQKGIAIYQIYQFNKAFAEMTKSKYLAKSADFDSHLKRNWRILRRNGFRPTVVKSFKGRSWLEVTIGREKITVDTWGKFIGKSTKTRHYPILKSKQAPYGHKGYTRIRRGKPEQIQQKGVPNEVATGISLHDVVEAQRGNNDAFQFIWNNLFAKMLYKQLNTKLYLTHEDKEDIEQETKLAIWEKLPAWSPDKSSRLGTYFHWTILGVIKQYEEDKAALLGTTQVRLLKEIYKAQTYLYDKLKRNATPEEIAQAVQVDTKDVVDILTVSKMTSFDDKVIGTEDLSVRDSEIDPAKQLEVKLAAKKWETCLKTLWENGIIDEEEVKFLDYYFWEGITKDNKRLMQMGITNPNLKKQRTIPRALPFIQAYYRI